MEGSIKTLPDHPREEPLPPLPKDSLVGPVVLALAVLFLASLGLWQVTWGEPLQVSPGERIAVPVGSLSGSPCRCPSPQQCAPQLALSGERAPLPSRQPMLSHPIPAVPAKKASLRAAPKEALRPPPVATPTPGKVKMKDDLD